MNAHPYRCVHTLTGACTLTQAACTLSQKHTHSHRHMHTLTVTYKLSKVPDSHRGIHTLTGVCTLSQFHVHPQKGMNTNRHIYIHTNE